MALSKQRQEGDWLDENNFDLISQIYDQYQRLAKSGFKTAITDTNYLTKFKTLN